MALVDGTNAGLCASAPTADPGGVGTSLDFVAWAYKITTGPSDTLIDEMGVYIPVLIGADVVEYGLLSHDAGNDEPEDLLEMVSFTPGGAGWHPRTSLGWAVTPSTTYWIAAVMNGYPGNAEIDFGISGGTRYATKSAVNALPSNWGASGSTLNGGIVAIYVIASSGLTDVSKPLTGSAEHTAAVAQTETGSSEHTAAVGAARTVIAEHLVPVSQLETGSAEHTAAVTQLETIAAEHLLTEEFPWTLSAEHLAGLAPGRTIPAEHLTPVSQAETGSAEHTAAVELARTIPAEHDDADSSVSKGLTAAAEHLAAVTQLETIAAEHLAAVADPLTAAAEHVLALEVAKTAAAEHTLTVETTRVAVSEHTAAVVVTLSAGAEHILTAVVLYPIASKTGPAIYEPLFGEAMD